MVKQAISSLCKHNILKLTQIFVTISLQDVADRVELSSAKEAEMQVLQMIEDGEIFATINQKDGTVSFLEDQEQYKSCGMVERIDSSIQSIMALSRKLIAMNENISCDPMYLAKVGSERQQFDFDVLTAESTMENCAGRNAERENGDCTEIISIPRPNVSARPAVPFQERPINAYYDDYEALTEGDDSDFQSLVSAPNSELSRRDELRKSILSTVGPPSVAAVHIDPIAVAHEVSERRLRQLVERIRSLPPTPSPFPGSTVYFELDEFGEIRGLPVIDRFASLAEARRRIMRIIHESVMAEIRAEDEERVREESESLRIQEQEQGGEIWHVLLLRLKKKNWNCFFFNGVNIIRNLAISEGPRQSLQYIIYPKFHWMRMLPLLSSKKKRSSLNGK